MYVGNIVDDTNRVLPTESKREANRYLELQVYEKKTNK